MSRNLVVLPDDSAKPIFDAIRASKKSIRVKMFLFSDPALLDAVVLASRRGVKVRVMLNSARRNGEEENEQTRRKLRRANRNVDLCGWCAHPTDVEAIEFEIDPVSCRDD